MFVSSDLFAARLRHTGLSAEEFASLVTEGGADIRELPEFVAWIRDLGALHANYHAGADLAPPRGLDQASESAALFWSFLRPFVHFGLGRLRERLRHGRAPIFLTAEIEDQLVQALAVRLVPRCTPTLVLELNVARVSGLLDGNTSAERFRAFVERTLQQPEVLRDLVTEYPVLYRSLLLAVDDWVQANATLFERLAEDRELLHAHFGLKAGAAELVRMRSALSDPHRHGQSVVHLVFASGRQLIYKPRSLAVDAAFSDFIIAINEMGLKQPLYRPTVLDRGAYGWMEYLEHLPCANEDEVRLFYQRLGSLVAIVHMLCGVDFHYENLIASGANPVLVDLEGLLHPPRVRRSGDTAFVRAQRCLDDSVMGTGLLPQATAIVHQRLDLSGLGGRSGQVWPRMVPIVRRVGTDEMHISLGHTTVPAARNRPWMDGREIDGTDYVDDVVTGFFDAAGVLASHKNQIERLLPIFGDVQVRYIARPTARYAVFLREGWHPDYLRDAISREHLLDKLWSEAERRPELAAILPSEQADLRRGDIPYFMTQPSSRLLWDSTGRCIENYIDEPSLDVARRRLRNLSGEEQWRQAGIIRQAVLSVKPEAADPPAYASTNSDECTSDADFIAAAIQLAEYLKARAILGPDDACWIGPVLQKREHWEWRIAPLGAGLYEGLGGMALLFAELAELTGRADFDDLAVRTLQPIRRYLREDHPVGTVSIGAFSGAGSLAYTLAVAAAIRRDSQLLLEATNGLLRFADHVGADEQLDLVGGSAGCGIVSLLLYERTHDARLLELADRCGARLNETARRQNVGVGWIGIVADRPIAGLAHGGAGIAWALLSLEKALGARHYGVLAEDAVAHERSLFVAGSQSTIDPGRGQVPRGFGATAWCHGSAGVALARLMSLQYRDDPQMAAEINVGISDTLRQGFSGSQCLCHGALGNAEIVSYAAARFNRPEWREQALAGAERICRSVLGRDWRCGLPGRVESPSFMTGLSGIAYSLIRFVKPQVPAALWLELR